MNSCDLSATRHIYGFCWCLSPLHELGKTAFPSQSLCSVGLTGPVK